MKVCGSVLLILAGIFVRAACDCSSGSEPLEVDVDTGTGTCQPCPNGKYSPDGNECRDCQPGFSQPNNGESSCEKCSSGKYQDGYGKWSCKICPAGKYSDGDGSSDCKDCNSGWFQSNLGETGCEKCPAGKSALSSGKSACEICEAGKYQENKGQGACSPCARGRYNPTTGSSCPSDCIPVPAGKYSDKIGSSQALDCPIGRFSDSQGSIFCKRCQVGQIAAHRGQTACRQCASRRYANYERSSCYYCNAGYFCINGRSHPCPKGSYSTSHQSKCSPCPAGRWSHSRSKSLHECYLCECGHYCKRHVSIIRKHACVAGRFNSAEGATAGTSCSLCNQPLMYCPQGACSPKHVRQGFYPVPVSVGQGSDENGGEKECEPGNFCDSGRRGKCPAGSSSGPGQSNCDLCSAGKYSTEGSPSCTPCPENGGSYEGAAACWPGIRVVRAVNGFGGTSNLDAGDKVVIQFVTKTNCNGNSPNTDVSESELAQLFSFVTNREGFFKNTYLGKLTGSWDQNCSKLTVTVQKPESVGLEGEPGNYGFLYMQLAKTNNLKSPDGNSDVAFSQTAIQDIPHTRVLGSWGNPTEPLTITEFSLQDLSNTPGLAKGDTMRIVLDRPSNICDRELGVIDLLEVDRKRIFHFYSTAAGSKTTVLNDVELRTTRMDDLSTVDFVVVDIRVEVDQILVHPEFLHVELLWNGNVRPLALTAPASNASSGVTGGTWGPVPMEMGVSVRDPGQAIMNVEFSSYDTQTISSVDIQAMEAMSTNNVINECVFRVPMPSSGKLTIGCNPPPQTIARSPSIQLSLRLLTSADMMEGGWMSIPPGQVSLARSKIITFSGSTRMDTSGGTIITLCGTFRLSEYSTILGTYSNGNFTVHTRSCAISSAIKFMVCAACQATAGIGAAYQWRLNIDGLDGEWSGPDLTTSYNAPSIQSVRIEEQSNLCLHTSGGEQVFVSGTNFGIRNSSTIRVNAEAEGPPVGFSSPRCLVSEPDKEIVCNTSEGAGSRLQWSASVGGVTSVLPTSSFSDPVIDSVFRFCDSLLGDSGLARAVAEKKPIDDTEYDRIAPLLSKCDHNPQDLPSSGNIRLAVVGRELSPSDRISEVWLLRPPVGDRPDSVRLKCSVVISYRMVLCMMPPGVGISMRFQARRFDQWSDISSATVAYRPPSISHIVPSRIPVAADSTLEVYGDNLAYMGISPSDIIVRVMCKRVKRVRVVDAGHVSLVLNGGSSPTGDIKYSVQGQSVALRVTREVPAVSSMQLLSVKDDRAEILVRGSDFGLTANTSTLPRCSDKGCCYDDAAVSVSLNLPDNSVDPHVEIHESHSRLNLSSSAFVFSAAFDVGSIVVHRGEQKTAGLWFNVSASSKIPVISNIQTNVTKSTSNRRSTSQVCYGSTSNFFEWPTNGQAKLVILGSHLAETDDLGRLIEGSSVFILGKTDGSVEEDISAECHVVSTERAECPLSAGVGEDWFVQVKIGTFKTKKSNRFCYSPPEIVSVSPSLLDPAGGEFTITGRHFGTDDRIGGVTVTARWDRTLRSSLFGRSGVDVFVNSTVTNLPNFVTEDLSRITGMNQIVLKCHHWSNEEIKCSYPPGTAPSLSIEVDVANQRSLPYPSISYHNPFIFGAFLTEHPNTRERPVSLRSLPTAGVGLAFVGAWLGYSGLVDMPGREGPGCKVSRWEPSIVRCDIGANELGPYPVRIASFDANSRLFNLSDISGTELVSFVYGSISVLDTQLEQWMLEGAFVLSASGPGLCPLHMRYPNKWRFELDASIPQNRTSLQNGLHDVVIECISPPTAVLVGSIKENETDRMSTSSWYVKYGDPVIDAISFEPLRPSGGSLVTIIGYNFGVSRSISVGGRPCVLMKTDVETSRSVVCRAPVGVGKGVSITMRLQDQQYEFQVDYARPVLESLSPNPVPQSRPTELVFRGSGFGPPQLSNVSVCFSPPIPIPNRMLFDKNAANDSDAVFLSNSLGQVRSLSTVGLLEALPSQFQCVCSPQQGNVFHISDKEVRCEVEPDTLIRGGRVTGLRTHQVVMFVQGQPMRTRDVSLRLPSLSTILVDVPPQELLGAISLIKCMYKLHTEVCSIDGIPTSLPQQVHDKLMQYRFPTRAHHPLRDYSIDEHGMVTLHSVCPHSHFLNATGDCQTCPEGALCLGDDIEPISSPGYVRLSRLSSCGDPSQQQPRFVRCSAGEEACLGGFFSGNMECSASYIAAVEGRSTGSTDAQSLLLQCTSKYTGQVCEECAPNHFSENSRCHQCPNQAYIVIAFMTVLVVALAVAVLLVARYIKRFNSDGITILLDYMQIFTLIVSIGFPWPQIVKSVRKATNVLLLDVQATRPECSIKMTFIQQWLFTQLLPLCLVGILLLLCLTVSLVTCMRRLCLKVSKKGGRESDDGLRAVDTIVGITIATIYLLYFPSVRGNLVVFNCRMDAKGERIMDAYPEQSCDDPKSDRNLILPYAYASLGLYTVGIPVLCLVILLYNRAAIISDLTLTMNAIRVTQPEILKVRMRFGRLYFPFTFKYYYWRLVQIARKFILVCSTIFLDHVMIQASAAVLVLFVFYLLQELAHPFNRMVENENIVEVQKTGAQGRSLLKKAKPSRVCCVRLDKRGRVGCVDPAKLYHLFMKVYNFNKLESACLKMCILLLLSGMYFMSLEGTSGGSHAVFGGLVGVLVVVIMVWPILLCILLFLFELLRATWEARQLKLIEEMQSASECFTDIGNTLLMGKQIIASGGDVNSSTEGGKDTMTSTPRQVTHSNPLFVGRGIQTMQSNPSLGFQRLKSVALVDFSSAKRNPLMRTNKNE